MLIHRRCACGCGQITNLGKRYICGHHTRNNKRFKHIKIKRRCKCGCDRITSPGMKWISGHNGRGRELSKNHKLKIALTLRGTQNRLGHKHSEKTKNKMALSHFKCNPNYEYCDEWKDLEYRKDLRKDYCENVNCKGRYKRLVDHHIDLNKRHCHPSNIMTLCVSCSTTLHRRLDYITGKRKKVNYKDYLTIIRKDKITYIHKRTKKVVILRRI